MLGWRDQRPLKEILPARLSRGLKRSLGYETADQLWAHLPRAYSVSGSAVNLDEVEAGEIVTCVAQVITVKTQQLRRRSAKERPRFLSKVLVTDGTSHIEVTFFNSPWVAERLLPGTRAMFSGKLSFFRGQVQLQHPKFIELPGAAGAGDGDGTVAATDATSSSGTGKNKDEDADADAEIRRLLAQQRHLPVYPVKQGITSWRILQAADCLLRATEPLDEPLDRVPEGLIGFDAAVRGVHLPGPEGPEAAVRRLKYNEAFTLACVTALRRDDNRRLHAVRCAPRPDGLVDRLLAGLGFELTAGQLEVLGEISADLNSTEPMSRLLQGEVGSGKTLVALAAMLQVIDNGHQCAFLAPTEVLAAQHARSLASTLERAGLDVTVRLLTGSMSVAEKRAALLAAVTGEADIVVGTHALLQDTVEFFRLGLAVVDEQHRFGVEQRDRLRLKGGHPHLLVMTATPIPRTIAMTVFGDLEVSTLRELPYGRRDVKSFLVRRDQANWVARVPGRIREEVAAGGRAYVVCPRIEKEGGVEDVATKLKHGALSGLRIGVLHGRMRPEEKERVMADFAAGRVQVLVSTTVIEVGVDVPEATVMLIRGAEHFGVSQIHQLRGRVGRGARPGVCFLYTESEQPRVLQRLAAVADTDDGFALAELDLELRQEGDILGASQSGRNSLRLLDMKADRDLIELARAEADALVARDRGLAESFAAEINPDSQDYIEKS